MNRQTLARRLSPVALIAALSALSVPAHAEGIDLAAITAAKTDALAVAGALLAMGIAVWGAMYIYRKFFR